MKRLSELDLHDQGVHVSPPDTSHLEWANYQSLDPSKR